jgi:hypothetical protein
MQNKIILLLSLPLSALIIIASSIGLFTPEFYSAETTNWQAQSIGQDFVDLFLVTPCLLISAILAGRSNRNAQLIWGGVLLYVTYTFMIYCFDVHFNNLFIVYCLCLGLSFYSLVYFLFTLNTERKKADFENKIVFRITGIYFIIISILFYFLWLSEIIPAILKNKIPKSVVEAGLFTNAVHVLDLSLILPAIFITGILLLKRNPLGVFLAPPLLTFFVLMDITIGTLVIIMKTKGLEAELSVTLMMIVLAVISLILLIAYFRSLKNSLER